MSGVALFQQDCALKMYSHYCKYSVCLRQREMFGETVQEEGHVTPFVNSVDICLLCSHIGLVGYYVDVVLKGLYIKACLISNLTAMDTLGLYL